MGALSELVTSGGPIVVILIVLSLVSLALIAYKTLQVAGVLRGESARQAAYESWSRGDKKAAIDGMAAGASPVDRILHRAMEGLRDGRARPLLDEDLEWRGNAELAGLGRHVRLLELIAMISPLLGLLGTVLGMIQAFRELALAEGAANASVLAAGIWQALLTTAAGLVVAIPAAIAAALLASRVDHVGQRIEAAVGRLYEIEDKR